MSRIRWEIASPYSEITPYLQYSDIQYLDYSIRIVISRVFTDFAHDSSDWLITNTTNNIYLNQLIYKVSSLYLQSLRRSRLVPCAATTHHLQNLLLYPKLSLSGIISTTYTTDQHQAPHPTAHTLVHIILLYILFSL